MRYLFFFFLIIIVFPAIGKDSGNVSENLCRIAIKENTNYKVLGIYGSPLESEWHPAAAYVLLKEIYRCKVLRKEFYQKSHPWRFECVEMVGKKKLWFSHPWHNHKRTDYRFSRNNAVDTKCYFSLEQSSQVINYR